MTDSQSTSVTVKWLIRQRPDTAESQPARDKSHVQVIHRTMWGFGTLCVAELIVCCLVWWPSLWILAYFGFWSGVTVLGFAIGFTTRSRWKKTRAKMADVATTVDKTDIRRVYALAGIPIVFNFFASLALYAKTPTDWYSALGNLIVGAAGTVLVAFAGWFFFNLTNGFQACLKLVLHQRKQLEHARKAQIPMGDRSLQAQSVLQRLKSLDDDETGVLLTALTEDAGNGLADDLEKALNKADMVALRLNQPPAAGSYALEVQTQFQALMRRAKVAPHLFLRGADSYLRVLEHLTLYRKIVVIVRNMDDRAITHGPAVAKEDVEDRTAELQSAGYTFVSIIRAISLPDSQADNVIQVTPPNDLKIRLPPQHRAETQNQADSLVRAVRQLAIALQPTGLRVSTVYAQKYDTDASTRKQRAALHGRGLIRFGSDLVREALTQAGPTHVLRPLIGSFIERLVISGSGLVASADLYEDVSQLHRLTVSSALHELTHTRPGELTRDGLLTYTGSPGPQRFLAFQDAQLAEIAVGRWLAESETPYLFSRRRTALCTAAEIYGRLENVIAGPSLRGDSVWPGCTPPRLADRLTRIWNDAMTMLARSSPEEPRSTALFAAGGALNAVSSLRYPFEVSSFEPLWDAADPDSRRIFVERLTETSACRLAKWLWAKAIDNNAWQTDRHILDRTLCRKLGTSGRGSWNGESIWTQLTEQWSQLSDAIHDAAAKEISARDLLGLNWKTKSEHRSCDEHPLKVQSLGLLGWLLPSLVVSTRESARAPIEKLLDDLHAVLAAPVPTSAEELPNIDIGVQIALAEGCRDACYHGLVEGSEIPSSVTNLAKALIFGDRTAEDPPRPPALAWYSWLVALQALFVAAAAASDTKDPDELTDPAEVAEATTDAQIVAALDNLRKACDECCERGHSIVKRYAAILQAKVLRNDEKQVDRIELPHATVGRYTWLDDNKAVSQAGGALEPEVVQILAESVSLLNFSGASEILDTISSPPLNSERGQARIKGLTRVDLPLCFEDPDAAKAANDYCPRSCQFDLCRPGMFDTPVRRTLSRTFLERCRNDTEYASNEAVQELLKQSASKTDGELHQEIAKELRDEGLSPDTWVLVRGAVNDRVQRLWVHLDKEKADTLERALERRFNINRDARG